MPEQKEHERRPRAAEANRVHQRGKGRCWQNRLHTGAGLDMFIDCLAEGTPVVLADTGAGSG